MQDVTYTELIILEYRDQTELADGKYDGRINMQDVTQIELVILGKEKELTYIDCDGDAATVNMPVEKIVVAYNNNAEMVRVLEATDGVVGVCDDILKYPVYFPDMSEKPCVGRRFDFDVEAILELEPDIVFTGTRAWYTPDLEDKLKGTGIDVVRLSSWEYNRVLAGIMKLGYILDEEENAYEYREWHNECTGTVTERVSEISEDEKLRVFVDRPGGTSVGKGSGYAETVEMAGGINLASSLGDLTYPEVDLEWVIDQNPDVIVGISFEGNYETDDVSVIRARYDEIIGTTGFEYIDAVKNDRVYVTHYIIQLGPSYPVGVTYLAKWFYPDLFEDLDPQEIHQEYIDRFQGMDFDVSEHGVFAYPPLEVS